MLQFFIGYISATRCKVWSTFGQVIFKVKRVSFYGSSPVASYR